jgi:hypothetical protein
MLSVMISSSSGENLTPACQMGGAGVYNTVFILKASL